MIRINLSPAAATKRKNQANRATRGLPVAMPSTQVSKGSIYAILMLLGWVGIGVIAWLLQNSVAEDTARLKNNAATLAQQTKDINEKIDEEDLQARFNRYEELTAAAEALQKKRRTPVYVYHELANILTTGKQPDIDEAEQRRRVDLDAQARLDLDWDAQSVWLMSMEEESDDVLEITGGMRDPDDLSEFVKRLRASARFARISHPEFEFEEVKKTKGPVEFKELKPGESIYDHYTFELTAEVRYWD